MDYFTNIFVKPGQMSFIIGGQWGSEGKGSAAAWLAKNAAENGEFWDVITTNAGAQAGHTSTHRGKTVVTNHLPTAAIIGAEYGFFPIVYLNSGCIIDPDRLLEELEEHPSLHIMVHPNAAVITPENRALEKGRDSHQTSIGSTQKGVGEALVQKTRRDANAVAGKHPAIRHLCGTVNLNHYLGMGKKVLCEIPQGYGLSISSQFYPYTTSRNCTLGQALSDAQVHPSFAGRTMMVLRTYPIRVGNIVEDGKQIGYSGNFFSDQRELTWEEIGKEPELTTVTKRQRRLFTFSGKQTETAMAEIRPDVVYLSFVDYVDKDAVDRIHGIVHRAAVNSGLPMPKFLYGCGPTTDDVFLSAVSYFG